VGVLCGRAELMRRSNPDRPADICFARGTFNAHPYVMGAMNAFLRAMDTPEIRALYDGLDARWNARADSLNGRLADEGLPPRVANLSTIWTVNYVLPSRYNWMFQYYLRAEGLALSWVGTGRLIFSLNYSDADFQEVAERFVAATRAMHADGWWWTPKGQTNKAIRRAILREAVRKRFLG
jgi:glutamate-1-semialdehyde 2,1-aminomutase